MAGILAHQNTIWGLSNSLANVLAFSAQKYHRNVPKVYTL